MNIQFVDKLTERFLGSKQSVGCDFGATHLKLVKLKKNKDALTLVSLGIFEADISNAIAIQRARAYLQEHGFSGSRVNLNIEDESLRIRRMDLPEMPDSDLKVAIKWNFREYIDVPIEKYTVSFSKLGAMVAEEGKKPVIAYGVATEAVFGLIKAVKQMELRAATVEPNAAAILTAFDAAGLFEGDKKNYVVIDIGSRTANFVAMGSGLLLFSRPMAGVNIENLKGNIASALSVKEDQASTYLRSYLGLGKDVIPDEVLSSIKTIAGDFLSQLVIEIQRSIDAFCLMYRLDKTDAIYLAGAGSMIPDICSHLSTNLGVETKIFNPFDGIDTGAVGAVTNPQLYAVAVGLAVPRA